jgi:signal transduction histidine kinase
VSEKQGNQIRTGVVVGVLLASGFVLLLLPFFALRWAQLPFPGFLLDPNLVVSDTGNEQWVGKQYTPPIGYPERIVAIDGQPIADDHALQQLLTTHEVGDEVSITLIQPINSRVLPQSSTAERIVSVQLTAFSAGDLWNHFWLFFLTGTFIWVSGAWTFRTRPQDEEAQLFALLTSLGALSIAAVFDQITTHSFLRIWIFSLSMIGTLGVWLAYIFPHEPRLIRRWPWLRGLVLMPGVVTAVWGELWLNQPIDPWAYAIPWRFAYLLNGIGLLTILIMMAYRGYGSKSALVRQQGRIILVGSILAFAPLVLFFLAAAFAVHLPWLPVTLYLPPVIIFPLAIGYTIVRYRLVDTGSLVIRQSVAYAVVTGLLAITLFLLVTSLTATFGSVAERPWLIAILLVAAVLAFDPIRSRFQRGIDQVIFRQPAAFDDLQRDFHKELTTAVHMNQVAEVLLKYIHLGIPNVETNLYLPDHKTSVYASYANHNNVVINIASPLIEFMRHQSGPIDLAEERAWPDTFVRHRELVSALKADVIIPMTNGTDLLGWVTLAPKEANQPFQTNHLTYLNALTQQSLISMERANVVRRLENRISDLDVLTQFSQFLSFTVEQEDLFELVYTNFERLLKIDDFFVALLDEDQGIFYKAFHVERSERLTDQYEGKHCLIESSHVIQVMETGQSQSWQDENGRFWFATPLNAGRKTLGVVYTFYRNPARVLRPRQQQLFGVFADRTAVAIERLRTNQALKERANQLEIINQVTFSLASTLELDPLLEIILDKAMELLATEAGTFMLALPDTGELEFRVVKGPASKDLIGNRLPVGTGLSGTAAQTGRPVLVNNVQDDKRWFSQVADDATYATNSILTVPLIRQNTVLGVLQVINKQNGVPFDEDDQQLLMTFSGQAVVAIENARLLSQTDLALQKSVDELSLLQQLDRDLNTTLDLDHVLNITLERMMGICSGTAGAIVLVNEERRPYSIFSLGYDESFQGQSDPEILAGGIVGKVIRTGKPHITGNVHEEDTYIAASYATHSQMTLPLFSKQNLIGIIAVEADRIDAFNPYDVETAVRVANHAAVAIANAILYDQVNEANQAKSEFVTMVSHELKTPMTAIRGYVDLMLSGMGGDLSDQQHNFLETIAANIRRMSQQIQDLTDISRIEMNRLHMEMTPTSLQSVMQETMQTVQSICDEKNIRLQIDLAEHLPRVMADKARLVQVMTNLLSNACKYSPEDTEVHLSFSQFDGNPPFIQCAVSDNGYGISEEDIKRLFTQFFRSDNPNIRKSKGTGLGLSITKGIIELHGGQIWVQSRLGEGTTFYVTIPQVVT